MNTIRQQLNCLFSVSVVCITMMLSACIDLSGSIAVEKKIKHEQAKHPKVKKTKKALAQKRRGEVHTMLGGLGIFSTGMNQLKNSVAAQYHIPASSSMWYQSGAVSQAIVDYYYKHQTHRPIILVGHSLGANEQINVARHLEKVGIPVDLLVTVDAVSVFTVPANVRQVLNIYKPGFVPMFSGLKLRAVNPKATHIDNVNVNKLAGVKVNHFTIDKHEFVQSMIMNKVEKVLSNANRKEA